MSTAQENLEERIVRIRKRDEEIEKKHRLAEEDRLMALKQNAMVKTTSPSEDDWPKGHKYDSIDFTYDNELQDEEKLAKKLEKSKPAKEYKKFHGSGPPPDPTYNFLKDAERDGVAEKTAANEKKDWRQKNNASNNSRSKNELNNSFRGRNGKQRNGNNGNNSGVNRNGKQDEHGSWKNERNRIDESRIGRQKGGDGKWRREWDTDKQNEDDICNKMEKTNIQSIRSSQHQQFQLHQQQQQQQHHQQATSVSLAQQQQRSPNHSMRSIQGNQNVQVIETPMEKRGNIMVSVSQDGEVKSVKLVQSTQKIGTGRVGHRQNSKPQFPIQNDTFPTVTQYQPDDTEYFIAPSVVPTSPRRLGPTLQDRLNRHRLPSQQPNNSISLDGKNNQSTASTESAQIAVGF